MLSCFRDVVEESEIHGRLIQQIKDANVRAIDLTGSLIQERPRLFMSDLGMTEFKGSYGWLNWKTQSSLQNNECTGERCS